MKYIREVSDSFRHGPWTVTRWFPPLESSPHWQYFVKAAILYRFNSAVLCPSHFFFTPNLNFFLKFSDLYSKENWNSFHSVSCKQLTLLVFHDLIYFDVLTGRLLLARVFMLKDERNNLLLRSEGTKRMSTKFQSYSIIDKQWCQSWHQPPDTRWWHRPFWLGWHYKCGSHALVPY